MTEQLKDTLIKVLTYFKTGLDDIEAGSEERQPMQDEIDFALPLVKKLFIADVVGTFCDCAVPDPIDPFAEVDKDTCRKCKNFIA